MISSDVAYSRVIFLFIFNDSNNNEVIKNRYSEDKIFSKDGNKTYKDEMINDNLIDKCKGTLVNNDYVK